MKKKRAIFTIITGSIAVVILTGVLLVGLNSEGFGVLRGPGQALGQAPGQTKGKEYVIEVDPGENPVEALEIDWEAGPVQVEVTTGSLVRITETSSRALTDEEHMKVQVSGGKLSIDWDHNRFRFFSFSFFGSNEKALVVELPRQVASALTEIECSNVSGDLQAEGLTGEEGDFSSVSGTLKLDGITLSESCSLSTTSGDIEVKGLSAETVQASTTSGEVSLEGLDAQEVGCSSTSGELSLEGSAGRVDFSTVSGDTRAVLSRCPEEGDFDSVSGSITVELPASACFTGEHSSVSGEFTCEFPSTGSQDGRALYGSGRAAGELSFSTTSGEMAVLRR